MEAEDDLKLLFQRRLGGGHLIEDEAAFDRRLAEELALPGLFTAAPPAPTPVGGGLCRVHLSALQGGPGLPALRALCARAARAARGTREELATDAAELQALLLAGEAPYGLRSPEAAAAAVGDFIAAGCPQPHHSGRFTQLYRPHYRLMQEDAALFLPVFAALDAALAQKPRVLLGIDGMCASGKSSLAALLAEVYGCAVIRADDFFLRPHQRSPERLAAPGGNIDYERLAPVVQRLTEGVPFSYQAYNCQSGEMDAWRQAPAGRLTVLEGAYSLGPQVAAPCDVRVFLCARAEVQARRVLARNGEAMARRFAGEWIPMENRYFGAFAVREGCDVVLDTSGLWGEVV